ncbi:MAG: hypothetical protein NC930_02385 [Candidatus Omnitrophica bacterium]|nr:hypothetical protein [Candidatus Omnitrophota bacterium]
MGSFKNTGSLLIPAMLLLCVGCASYRDVTDKIVPIHDEVLVYELPFDLVYLRTLEALELVDGWELEETEKEKGLIRVRNINFSSFADADKRIATFLVKRISREQTSVELAPESQQVIGVDKLLKSVSTQMAREL